MRFLCRLAILLMLLHPALAAAQTDDKTYLTRLLQDNLSGAGRVVDITGFQGALSSRASLTEMTIADDLGIWLTLRGVTLDWNRAALLSGRVEVSALTAQEIILDRIPQTGSAGLPAAEAAGFSLPVLPVSVSIGTVSADRVRLGQALFGTAAEVSLQGSMQLAGGEGTANIAVNRIDRADGRLSLTASYGNTSRQLALDLSLAEAPGGIAASLLGLPGQPSVALSVNGSGLIDDYTATISLQTDGQDRLAGRVRLTATASPDPSQPRNRFLAELAGDIAPLFAPDYRAFFGTGLTFAAEGARYPSGRIELSVFDLQAQAIRLSGRLALAADGLPELLDITGRIAAADGAPVLLPIPGPRTLVDSAALALRLDTAISPDWTGALLATGVRRPDFAAESLSLDGTGRVAGPSGQTGNTATGTLRFAAGGMRPANSALARALGSSASGGGRFDWHQGTPLRIDDLTLTGAGYSFALSGTVGGLDSALRFTGQATARIADLTPFSDLATRPVSGVLAAAARGFIEPLSGAFDMTASLEGESLAVGQPQLDRLLTGQSRISLSAARSTGGTDLRSLTLDAASLRARASGQLRSDASTLSADLTFDDLSALGAPWGGSFRGTGQMRQSASGVSLSLTGTGQDLTTGQTVLDPLLSGRTTVTLAARPGPAGFILDQLSLTSAAISARASGRLQPGSGALIADLAIADLAAYGNGFGGAVTATARLTLDGALRRLDLTGTGTGLRSGQPQLDRLLAGTTEITATARLADTGVALDSLTLATTGLKATASGTLLAGASRITGDLALADLSRLDQRLAGSVTARASFSDNGTEQRLDASGTGMGLLTGQTQLDRLLQYPSRFAFTARRTAADIDIDSFSLSNPAVSASGSGKLRSGTPDINATIALADLSVLGPPFGGALTARAHLTGNGTARSLDLTGTGTALRAGQAELDRLLSGQSTIALQAKQDGPRIQLQTLTVATAALTATASGTLQNGQSRLAARLEVTDLSAAGPGWRGTLDADATYAETGTARSVTVAATGTGLAVGQPSLDRMLTGTTVLSLAATEDQGTVRVERFRLTNPQLSAEATGTQTGSDRQLAIKARIADLARLAPGFPGSLTLAGSVSDRGGPYGVDLTAGGPAGINASITGTTARDFRTAALRITGRADAGLANALIAPRSIQGPVSYDLRLNGAPKLANLSGRLSTSGARLVLGTAGLVLDNLAATAALSGGRAQVTLTAGLAGAGGQVSIAGPVALAAPFAADLAVRLTGITLRNPQLFETSLSGALTVIGPLTGGARIAGQLDLGQTEVNVPSTGLGGTAAIPDLRHVNEPAAVRATRERAGLLRTAGSGLAAATAAYPLDVTINAPRRVFIRGRGLDAELGGSIRLSGTTAAIVPIGELSLIRGRLDILGKRFSLDEGLARLQGRFIPFIRLVASTSSDGITASVVIEGDANQPEISFQSAPELPEEEVLARLLFGRALTSISPLQAAQLASAVATLAGSGGAGIVNRLRSGFGLDDLDISTAADGTTALRVGKYLSDNVYTDVTIGADGKSQITLNLDLSPSVTVRGAFGSDGSTGLGVFYEKDY